MESVWDIDKIKSILPQRYPFLFIDKVVEIDPEHSRIVCLKNVSINDYFFEGHFPGTPVLPGALIIEAMAQASILLYAMLKPENVEKKPLYLLGAVEAKFKNPVKVGDQLFLESQRKKITDTAGIVSAIARAGDVIAARADISFGVQFKEGKE